jgi:phosphoribosylformylglycinamidine synthase
MTRFKVLLMISYKSSARDPEGETIAHALRNLGYEEVRSVRAGKAFVFEVESSDAEEATSLVKRIAAETRLYNPSVHEITVVNLA